MLLDFQLNIDRFLFLGSLSLIIAVFIFVLTTFIVLRESKKKAEKAWLSLVSLWKERAGYVGDLVNHVSTFLPDKSIARDIERFISECEYAYAQEKMRKEIADANNALIAESEKLAEKLTEMAAFKDDASLIKIERKIITVDERLSFTAVFYVKLTQRYARMTERFPTKIVPSLYAFFKQILTKKQ